RPETAGAAFSFVKTLGGQGPSGEDFVKRLLVMSTVAVVAACAHAPTPVVGPAPTTSSGTIVARPSTPPATVNDSTIGSDAVRPLHREADDSAHVSAAEVTKRAAEVFGDSAARMADPDSSASTAHDGPSWDIDVHSYETTARVEHYLRVFSGSAREDIIAQLEAGSRFEPMIRAKMRAGGLPEDMYYMALIESGYDPNAYSRAAAGG